MNLAYLIASLPHRWLVSPLPITIDIAVDTIIIPTKLSLLHHRTHLSKLTTTSTSTSVTTAVAAINSSDPVEKEQASSNKYYFVVANAKFMLDEEELFQEQLTERIRLYRERRNIEQDFWLVIEPKFLDKFPNFTKRLKRPAVALVSTNGPWITTCV